MLSRCSHIDCTNCVDHGTEFQRSMLGNLFRFNINKIQSNASLATLTEKQNGASGDKKPDYSWL